MPHRLAGLRFCVGHFPWPFPSFFFIGQSGQEEFRLPASGMDGGGEAVVGISVCWKGLLG